MTKVSVNQIYRQIYDRNREDIRIQTSGVIHYTFSKFADDMRYRDLLSTTRTIREKWSTLVSNGIIIDERRNHSAGMLNVHLLEVKVLGHSTSKDPLATERGARACVSGIYISEQAATEEGAQ